MVKAAMLKYSDSIINVVKLRSRALIYCGRTTLRMSNFPWNYSMDIEVSMTYSHYCSDLLLLYESFSREN